MGLVVGFGSKKRENFDPTASTVGLGPSNRFSYGLSVIGILPSRPGRISEGVPPDDLLSNNERWCIPQ